MKLQRFGFLVLVLVLALSRAAVATSETDSPSAVVQALYKSSLVHFGFSPESVQSAKPWVAPMLYARLWKKVNEPTPKGDAPDIEGDVFLDSQEVPTKYIVNTATISGSKAKVGVTLNWDAEQRHYIVLLEQINGAWKVTDVNYDKDGKLTDLL